MVPVIPENNNYFEPCPRLERCLAGAAESKVGGFLLLSTESCVFGLVLHLLAFYHVG